MNNYSKIFGTLGSFLVLLSVWTDDISVLTTGLFFIVIALLFNIAK